MKSKLVLAHIAVGLFLPLAAVPAPRSVHEQAAVEPGGSIEIVNVSGSIKVSGWDRPEIEVTGTVGEGVDRVEVTGGAHAAVRVIAQSGAHGDREAELVVRVPLKSDLTATLVSSDITLDHVQGNVRLQTVSGDVHGEVAGDLQASTVSGDLKMRTPGATRIEIKTVSGDILLSGGGGEVEIGTISGKADIQLTSLAHGRFKSVSGDMTAAFALAADGEVEGESVSGDLAFNFAQAPTAGFDVQTLSGTIDNCFGPKPTEPRYGPGSRLSFSEGTGRGHVRIGTKSGDVHLCTLDSHGHRSASRTPVRFFPLI